MDQLTNASTWNRMSPGRILGSEYFALLLCIGVFLGFAPWIPGLADAGNLANLVMGSLPLLVLAAGQTVVLVAGGIDLSVTAILGLSSVMGALVMSRDHGLMPAHPASTIVGVLVMIATGALAGCFNGVCVARLRMPPFMVTLISGMFVSGLGVWLVKKVADSESLYNLPASFLIIGTHSWLSVLIALLAILCTHLLLARTLLGKWWYAVGHNSQTALLSGVPVANVSICSYVLSGTLAAAAGVLVTARLETGSASHGKSLLLDVVGAVVIGGTSLFGGKGRVSWTVFGVLLLALIGNALNLLNVSDFMITIIKGFLILLAALLDVWRVRASKQNPRSAAT